MVPSAYRNDLNFRNKELTKKKTGTKNLKNNYLSQYFCARIAVYVHNYKKQLGNYRQNNKVKQCGNKDHFKYHNKPTRGFKGHD